MVRCKAEPAFYGQDEKTDLAAAVLEEEPFVEYVVRGNQLRQYAVSTSVDPREFASLTKYTFPILIHGEYKGGLIIVGNLDGDGNVIRPAMPQGAYVCSGFVGPSVKIEEYRERFPLADGYHVSFVSIVGGASAILVTDHSNALFVLEGEVLTPLADAGKRIRDSAVAAIELQDSDWELKDRQFKDKR